MPRASESKSRYIVDDYDDGITYFHCKTLGINCVLRDYPRYDAERELEESDDRLKWEKDARKLRNIYDQRHSDEKEWVRPRRSGGMVRYDDPSSPPSPSLHYRTPATATASTEHPLRSLQVNRYAQGPISPLADSFRELFWSENTVLRSPLKKGCLSFFFGSTLTKIGGQRDAKREKKNRAEKTRAMAQLHVAKMRYNRGEVSAGVVSVARAVLDNRGMNHQHSPLQNRSGARDWLRGPLSRPAHSPPNVTPPRGEYSKGLLGESSTENSSDSTSLPSSPPFPPLYDNEPQMTAIGRRVGKGGNTVAEAQHQRQWERLRVQPKDSGGMQRIVNWVHLSRGKEVRREGAWQQAQGLAGLFLPCLVSSFLRTIPQL